MYDFPGSSFPISTVSAVLAVRLDCIVNWHVSNQILFEVSLRFEEFLLKICLKMKDVKEYSVKWTRWDSNRGCLKFNK